MCLGYRNVYVCRGVAFLYQVTSPTSGLAWMLQLFSRFCESVWMGSQCCQLYAKLYKSPKKNLSVFSAINVIYTYPRTANLYDQTNWGFGNWKPVGWNGTKTPKSSMPVPADGLQRDSFETAREQRGFNYLALLFTQQICFILSKEDSTVSCWPGVSPQTHHWPLWSTFFRSLRGAFVFWPGAGNHGGLSAGAVGFIELVWQTDRSTEEERLLKYLTETEPCGERHCTGNLSKVLLPLVWDCKRLHCRD